MDDQDEVELYCIVGEPHIYNDYYACRCSTHYMPGAEDEETVAVFTSEKKAKAYLEASKLKSYDVSYIRDPNKQFRAKSLLRGYVSAYVQRYYPPDELPVDPEL